MQILLKLIVIMKQEDPALSPLALATAAPGVRSSWSSPPLSCSSVTASPRRSSTRRGRWRRRRRRRPARRRPRSQIYNLAPQVISMSPFQAPTISRRCRIPTSSWCRCRPWPPSSSPSSTSHTSAHVQMPPPHPEDAVKLFQPFSWLSCWLFFFCF